MSPLQTKTPAPTGLNAAQMNPVNNAVLSWVPFELLSTRPNSSRMYRLSASLFHRIAQKHRVDQALFSRYAEFNAFEAIAGNTMAVVPETSTIVLYTAAWIVGRGFRQRRHARHVSYSGESHYPIDSVNPKRKSHLNTCFLPLGRWCRFAPRLTTPAMDLRTALRARVWSCAVSSLTKHAEE
jgi:hypothetical protein